MFHALGDIGGIHGNEPQDAIAAAVQDQIAQADLKERPKFLFHRGDIEYPNGERSQYAAQFYEPYQYYDAPFSQFRETTTAKWRATPAVVKKVKRRFPCSCTTFAVRR